MNFKRFTDAAVLIFSLAAFSAMSFAATKPLNMPQGLALDSKGNLYVANYGGNQVLIYSPVYAQETVKTIAKGVSSPTAVLVDILGNIWVANLSGGPSGVGSVTEYSSAGIQDTTRTLSTGINLPYAMATDGLGDIWVQNNFNTVTVYPDLGTGPIKTIPFSQAVTGIAIHNNWIALGGNTALSYEEIAPYLASASYAVGTSFPTNDYSLAMDAAGKVYYGTVDEKLNVADFNAGTAFQLVDLGYFPWGIAVDSARGRVYVSNSNNNQINVYSTTTGALLHTIQ